MEIPIKANSFTEAVNQIREMGIETNRATVKMVDGFYFFKVKL